MTNNWVARAIEELPSGRFCHFCKKENDFADDCGWWYKHDTAFTDEKENYFPACRECFGKPTGDR